MVKTNVTKKDEKVGETLSMSPEQICAMFYVLVRQNQCMGDDNVMSFPMELFKTLPKKPKLLFYKKNGCLVAKVPDEDIAEIKALQEKPDIYVEEKKIIQ